MMKILSVCRLSALLITFQFFPCGADGADFRVYSAHPRLFFRDAPWGERGLTLDMIRERARRPEGQAVLNQLDASPPNLALRTLLLDDHAAARRVIDILQEPLLMKEITTDEGIEVGWRAMAYDWLYHHPDFAPHKKRRAAEIIAKGAERLIYEMDHTGAHIFHTRMYGWAMGIAMAGLALHGDHPQAEHQIRYGRDYFVDKLFPARQLQDGTVHNGFGYGRKYTMWLTAHFISSWYSATGENLWDEIARNQNDWARREILFLHYGRYPDKTYLRFGDSYSLFSDNYTFRAVSERTWAYGDPLGSGVLQKLISENNNKVVEKSSAYIYFLFHDPMARSAPPETLPTKMLFSRQGTGMAIWKSSWDSQGTTVFFKCGNYFDDHGHFDQGHLDVFRRSLLLLDSGSYLTFSGPFRTQYWHRSVAHNTILIVDPAIPGDEGGQRVFHSQSDGTLSQYLSNKQSETGDILDYLEEPGLAYVAGDISAAYPPDRAKSVTRELAFADDRYLVVLDRVTTGRKDLVPKVLWHTPIIPCIDSENRRFNVERNGARVIVNTLLPKKPHLEWIKGFSVGAKSIAAVGEMKSIADMGAGRVEVSAGGGNAGQYLFLHVLDIADSADKPGRLMASIDRDGIRVIVGKRTLLFTANRAGLIRGGPPG